ncbi:nuclear transport factor 2 family protein [Bremerella sp. T1]|uniref:nuclear transport factor 2 family protein n=1 Tax=Bremerella sp. TYQ1 TaxID=3119568 RepID=UPI001CCB7452|nr:nuclear transport factor 2 family protein [Bremerella volcania]UBM37102.1 nuclear transport factor 2 family protein [Bremerella volcania]
MSLNLPQAVTNYFQADELNGESVARCFTESAVVTDEGNTYRGQAAIRQWKDDIAAKYDYTCEPFNSVHEDGKVVVTCRLTGNFPGSPADLRFRFELEGDQIATLEIAP